jgi:hypothetical protein
MAIRNVKRIGFLSKYFDFYAFIIALLVGILLVFLLAPKKKLVYKFPSPDNIDVIYTDGSTCYRYEAKKVSCDNVPIDNIKSQPVI